MQPQNNTNKPKGPSKPKSKGNSEPKAQINSNLNTSRGQAVRAQRRSQADAQRIANQYVAADSANRPKRANVIDDQPRLKIIGLGGMDGGGRCV